MQPKKIIKHSKIITQSNETKQRISAVLTYCRKTAWKENLWSSEMQSSHCSAPKKISFCHYTPCQMKLYKLWRGISQLFIRIDRHAGKSSRWGAIAPLVFAFFTLDSQQRLCWVCFGSHVIAELSSSYSFKSSRNSLMGFLSAFWHEDGARRCVFP